MSDYTPTTATVRERFADGFGLNYARALEDFDRWLAAHDAEKHAEWEAEQGDKPDPCVMTHTPPFDFAQCETHDETFPLGGTCKWHGKRSVAEVLQDEADEQRARAVRAEHELGMLRAEQGEPEWERVYEHLRSLDRQVESLEGGIMRAPSSVNSFIRRYRYVRGRLPVPDTNNTESEDES